MDISVSLYEGEWIRLAAPEPERDAEIESRWTHDADYLRLLGAEPARPLAPMQIKKQHEAAWEEHGQGLHFYYAIRTLADDRLVGFARFHHIEWNHGAGFITLGLGDPQDRRRGYGTDTLRLLLRYAFAEINLHRLAAIVPEYNQAALRLFEKHGFTVEVRRRQALNRCGRRWDSLMLGLLREEWETRRSTH